MSEEKLERLETWRDYWPSLREIKAHYDRTAGPQRGLWLCSSKPSRHASPEVSGHFMISSLFMPLGLGSLASSAYEVATRRSSLVPPFSFTPADANRMPMPLFLTSQEEREAEAELFCFYTRQLSQLAHPLLGRVIQMTGGCDGRYVEIEVDVL